MMAIESRVPILYLAPWVDIGGSDKGTIDWFRFVDRRRFCASLITTQPSPNRRLSEVEPYAAELWELPSLMRGDDFPRFILAFIRSRQIRIVHIMNSRLGFELLPDIASLPDRPRVVVQLHVEEADRSGYVRYVTTRYGNLVDAFSLSSEALARRLGAYDVPIAKRRVIRTGVDAEREFCPQRVSPAQGLSSDRLQILFPARMTAQKDPLLMLEVAARLRARGVTFQIHVLGDGELTSAVLERRAALGLEDEIVMHGAVTDVAPWYRACGLLLLTSVFEGLPYAFYEAMAMGLPIVAPELPGLEELVTSEIGVLVRPRDDAESYANAISALAADPAGRREMGKIARARAQADLSLQRMAAEHRALYEELLANAPDPDQSEPARSDHHSKEANSPVAFRSRWPGGKPLVSVIVPCYEHGRYLPACLRSIARQTYHPIETIVVDDASTDPETLAVLASIERDHGAIVVRLPTNRGPAAARNVGIERARGRYVLPLDADNLLLSSAVADLVEQLGSAGEQIGFIYPNLQFFGNRNDYMEMPSYNLHALLSESYCDTSSLFDREIFERGFRWAEEIVLGHEDWDFALALAERGIRGEPARTKTLLHRKRGFTRSDLVETTTPFAQAAAARHPELFANHALIKGEWNPALTLIVLDPLETPSDLSAAISTAKRQTCPDFELIVSTPSEMASTELGRRLRRVPSELTRSRSEALAQCLRVARGRYTLALYGSSARLLADPAVIEKTLRILQANPDVAALAFADSGADQRPLQLLDDDGVKDAELGGLCWRTAGAGAPPASLSLPGTRPLEALAYWLGAQELVQWRHLRRDDLGRSAAGTGGPRAALGGPRHLRRRDARFREAPAALPRCPPGLSSRLSSSTFWRPAQTRLLCRHRHVRSGRYAYTSEQLPPEGCLPDRVLGCLRSYPLPGTTSLVYREQEAEFALDIAADPDDPALLGFFEQVPLPLFDELRIGRHPQTGHQVLVAGQEDPLAGVVETPTTIGYIESYPIQPRFAPHINVAYGLIGLVRTVDLGARRHRYAVGQVPPGVPAGELGALLAEAAGDCDPLWIDETGRVSTVGASLLNGRPTLRNTLHWVGDPLRWKGFSRIGPKVRASARRSLDSARIIMSPPPIQDRPAAPAGYLLRQPTIRTVALLAATHPVTGDQLLTTDLSEPSSLGYRDAALLGYLIATAPVTGKLGPIRPAAPWAARFGLVPLTK